MTALRNRTPLILLTLLAFGVSLVTAATHVHHDRGSGMAARAMTAGLCAVAAKAPCSPLQHQHEQDGCVLCWAASLVSASLVPDVPSLPAPLEVKLARMVAFIEAQPPIVRGKNFYARGPPVSHLQSA